MSANCDLYGNAASSSLARIGRYDNTSYIESDWRKHNTTPDAKRQIRDRSVEAWQTLCYGLGGQPFGPRDWESFGKSHVLRGQACE